MKDDRRQAIIEIVNENAIETQEELMKLLQQRGFETTQATISRDIRALRLIKKHDTNGRIRYFSPEGEGTGGIKFYSMFSDVGKDVRYAGNMVVIQCAPGTANAVCASLDNLQIESIVGTLAGDDTIFCVMSTENDAQKLKDKLIRLI